MYTYIALLRGINVSGHKKIKMEKLRKILSNGNLNNVHTYIQSGNIIFSSSSNDCKKLAKEISIYIYQEYGFDVPVIVKTVDQWSEIIESNPFLNSTDINPKSLYVTFLYDTPTREDIERLNNYEFDSEKYILKDCIIYCLYPNGSGRSKMTNNFFEKKLKVSATSRNWNTSNKLFTLASNK